MANGHKQPQPTMTKHELIAYNFIHKIYEYLKTLSKVYCKGWKALWINLNIG
jgi:hypothetical protein